MAAFETIMFDDGGTVVELQTPRSVRRAVENGVLQPDALVTLIALDGSSRRVRAIEIEALRPLFGAASSVGEAATLSEPATAVEAANDEIRPPIDLVAPSPATQVAAVRTAVPLTAAEAGASARLPRPLRAVTPPSAKPGGCGLVAWGWTLLIGGFLLSAAFPPASLAFLIGLGLLIFAAVRGVARRMAGGA